MRPGWTQADGALVLGDWRVEKQMVGDPAVRDPRAMWWAINTKRAIKTRCTTQRRAIEYVEAMAR